MALIFLSTPREQNKSCTTKLKIRFIFNTRNADIVTFSICSMEEVQNVRKTKQMYACKCHLAF